MPATPEELFTRFRRDGSAAALAELFDLTAPELMRVACHVARELADAEDLVQSTWLIAIEAAPRWNSSRPLLPWLLGILANTARAQRRRSARTPELTLLPRDEPSALQSAQARELDERLQCELDALEEPCRAVAILALAHDLKPQEIAHALGRSPGTVRVQLHRALERLRERLPRDIALAALFAGPFGKGLAGVRAAVLKGAAGAATAATLASIGGGLVMKKTIAACMLVAATAAVVWKTWPDRSIRAASGEDAAAETADARIGRPRDADPGPAGATASELASASRTALDERRPAQPPAAATVSLEGEVLDGETHLPLAGATVAYFEPVKFSLREATLRYADFAQHDSGDGVPRFAAGWPRLVEPLPPGAWRGREPVEVCAEPAAGTAAFAVVESGPNGRFALGASRSAGVVVVSHEGYDRVVVPLAGDPASMSVALWPARELAGTVVDESGDPLGQPIRLLFMEAILRVKDEARSEQWSRQRGPWLVDSAADGPFRVQVGAPWLFASSATRGFQVTSEMQKRDERGAPASRRVHTGIVGLEPGVEKGPVTIVVRRLAMLKIVDADTQEPIEDFSLIATSAVGGDPTYAGRFHERGGELELESGPGPDDSYKVRYPRRNALHVDVWSDDHLPMRIELPPAKERVDVTVALQPGEPPALAGRVVRGDEPVANATVVLNAYYAVAWQEDSLHRVDECVTSKEGSFMLHAPAGKFVALVRAEGRKLTRMVELPASAPLTIDLASGSSIEVTVRDPSGSPRKDAKVYVDDEAAQERVLFTDEDGRARFDDLPAGPFTVTLNGTRETHVPLPQDLKKVRLAEGATEQVGLTAPPAGPVHLRVHRGGVTDYSKWRACDGTYLASGWSGLSADGTLGVDAANFCYLQVAAPDGTEWREKVTAAILAARVLELPTGDLGYRGHAVDRVTGRPLAGARVEASTDDGEEMLFCRCDGEGRFNLSGLRGGPATLRVARVAKPARVAKGGGDVFEEAGGNFAPSQPPAPGGRELDLRVPEIHGVNVAGMTNRTFRGRVTDGRSGRPVQSAYVSFCGVCRDDDGIWNLWVEGGGATTGVEGTYEVVVPRCATYRAFAEVNVGSPQLRVRQAEWADDGAPETIGVRDFVLQ